MKNLTTPLVALVALLFIAAALPAQIIGSRYSCCNSPQLDLLQFGVPSLSAPGGTFLTTITPVHQSSMAFIVISYAEESAPWPLDPMAGYLLVNTAPQHFIGTEMMALSTSGVEWIYRLDIPQTVAAFTPIMVQCAKLDPAANWLLTDGWNTVLQP